MGVGVGGMWGGGFGERTGGGAGVCRRLCPHLVGDPAVHRAPGSRSGRCSDCRAGAGLGHSTRATVGSLAGGHASREDGMKDWITNVITRELKALRREIESYPSDGHLWEIQAGIANPGGILALHLAGNLQYFVGNVLGKNGYVRNRDAEFGSRNVPRADLLREID